LPAVGEKFAEWAPTISSIITGLAQGISVAIKIVTALISAAMPIIKAVFENGFKAIGAIIQSILGVFDGVIKIIRGVFTGDFRSVLDGIKEIFKSVFEGIKEVCMAPINAIKDGLTGIINKIRGVKKEKIKGPTDTTTGKRVSKNSGFARGTAYTPATFIAGENGPELITGAAGRKVFTAAQTQKIFANINSARKKERPLPFKGSTAGSGSKGDIKFNYQPTIVVDGNRPNDLKQKLEENNNIMIGKVKKLLKDVEEDKRRLSYA
jgi:hypothetical protein